MKQRWLLVFSAFMAIAMAMNAQVGLLRPKKTRVIAKLDLYWSAVVIAENFPTFFPVEVEVNLPKPRVSIEAIVSPWYHTFNTQATMNKETAFWGGLGLRYYFLGKAFPEAATGLFVEPEVFVHWKSRYRDPIVSAPQITSSLSMGYFMGFGYQHMVLDWLYLQGRCSVGLGSDPELSRYTIGNAFTVLPWVGIGFGLH